MQLNKSPIHALTLKNEIPQNRYTILLLGQTTLALFYAEIIRFSLFQRCFRCTKKRYTILILSSGKTCQTKTEKEYGGRFGDRGGKRRVLQTVEVDRVARLTFRPCRHILPDFLKKVQ